MRAIGPDRRTVAELAVEDVATYFRSRGWHGTQLLDGSAEVFKAPGESGIDALLPLNKEFGDYYRRFSEALLLLQQVEDRSLDSILQDIRAQAEDVFRVRIAGPSIDEGSVPLARGAKLFEPLEALFSAAASSVGHPVPYHVRPSQEAKAFLSTARLGQTERGSYVISILSRLPRQADFFSGSQAESFERRVFLTLANALAIASAAADVRDFASQQKAFRDGVPLGISANLCRAVASLGGRRTRELEFTVSWALRKPVQNVTNRVVFTQTQLQAIREAAKYLGAHDPLPNYELRGRVASLQKEEDEEASSGGFDPGTVGVLAFVGSGTRLVKVYLAPKEHLAAVEAYRAETLIYCRGTLHQQGDHFRLEEVTEFRPVN